MAEGINVSTQVLRDTAGKVRSINASLDEKLKAINQAMDALKSSWSSEAASEIQANMNALKPRFEEYKAVVESYAKFLVTTAESYDTTEGSIKTTASSFKQ